MCTTLRDPWPTATPSVGHASQSCRHRDVPEGTRGAGRRASVCTTLWDLWPTTGRELATLRRAADRRAHACRWRTLKAATAGGRTVDPVLAPPMEKLPEAIDRLVEHFDSLRIVLFGSHARNEARPDSDVDLLVVVPHLGDKRETAIRMRAALRGLRAAIDVVPTDPEEIARRGHLPGDVLRSALAEG